jgi:hypothetical protein
MKKRIKIISANNPEDLEEKTNAWLRGMDFPVIDKITPCDSLQAFWVVIEISLPTIN